MAKNTELNLQINESRSRYEKLKREADKELKNLAQLTFKKMQALNPQKFEIVKELVGEFTFFGFGLDFNELEAKPNDTLLAFALSEKIEEIINPKTDSDEGVRFEHKYRRRIRIFYDRF
jgi:hypothetical protein